MRPIDIGKVVLYGDPAVGNAITTDVRKNRDASSKMAEAGRRSEEAVAEVGEIVCEALGLTSHEVLMRYDRKYRSRHIEEQRHREANARRRADEVGSWF